MAVVSCANNAPSSEGEKGRPLARLPTKRADNQLWRNVLNDEGKIVHTSGRTKDEDELARRTIPKAKILIFTMSKANPLDYAVTIFIMNWQDAQYQKHLLKKNFTKSI